jgi:hypothetical protein
MKDISADHLHICYFNYNGCIGSMLIKMSEAAVSTVIKFHLGYLNKYLLPHKIWKTMGGKGLYSQFMFPWEGRLLEQNLQPGG